MGRPLTGALYQSHGSWFVSFKLDKRKSFRLVSGLSQNEAEARRKVLVKLVIDLRPMDNPGHLEGICIRAGLADETELAMILTLVRGLVSGAESVVSSVPSSLPPKEVTFGEFAELWLNGELNRRYPTHVRKVEHYDNRLRLEKHVYPVLFGDKIIRDTPLSEFTIDHADHVLSQPTIKKGSLRHVAQLVGRVLKLAVYPGRIIDSSPLPEGWLPRPNIPREQSFLFPEEEAMLLRATAVPFMLRLFFGFCCREGLRIDNAVTLSWSNLTLDLPAGRGLIVLDKLKNGRGGSWILDEGVAEAFRRLRKTVSKSDLVFPSNCPSRSRQGKENPHLYVEHAAEELREALRLAGVERPMLFQNTRERQHIRAHDLRATFVTLALASGRSEDWVRQRTGHRSSTMVARYRRDAATAREANLGWLKPLHEAIPELAVLGSSNPNERPEGGSQGQATTNSWTSCQPPSNPSEDE